MQQHSVYNTGASDGLIMGLFLSAIFLLQSYGLGNAPILLLIGDILMLGVPVMAYVMLRRRYMAVNEREPFAAVWLHGIIIFLCGSLIMATVIYLYLRLIDRTFIYRTFKLMSDLYEGMGTPETHTVAVTLQRMIDQHLLPTPISLAFTMVWFVGFTGSVLSCILALVVRMRRPKLKTKN